MASQVYFNGELYDCLATTVAGESPASAHSKWAKLEVPRFLEAVLVQGAYAGCMPREGQNDKRNAELAVYQRLLDDLTAEALIAERTVERTPVGTR